MPQINWSASACFSSTKQIESGTTVNALFWLGFGAGRLVGVVVLRYLTPKTVLYIDFVGINVSMIIMCVLGEQTAEVAWAITFFYSFFQGTVYPAGVSWTSQYTNMSGNYIFIFSAGQALGTMVLLPVGGVIFDADPFSVMYLILGCSLLNAATYLVMLLEGRRIEKKVLVNDKEFERIDTSTELWRAACLPAGAILGESHALVGRCFLQRANFRDKILFSSYFYDSISYQIVVINVHRLINNLVFYVTTTRCFWWHSEKLKLYLFSKTMICGFQALKNYCRQFSQMFCNYDWPDSSVISSWPVENVVDVQKSVFLFQTFSSLCLVSQLSTANVFSRTTVKSSAKIYISTDMQLFLKIFYLIVSGNVVTATSKISSLTESFERTNTCDSCISVFTSSRGNSHICSILSPTTLSWLACTVNKRKEIIQVVGMMWAFFRVKITAECFSQTYKT